MISSSSQRYLEEQREELHEVRDPLNPSHLEQEHVPVLDCPDPIPVGEPFPVRIEVGIEAPHSTDREHHIEGIDLYVDECLLARLEIPSDCLLPVVTLHVQVDVPCSELQACSHCNRHGSWLARHPCSTSD